MSLTPPFLLPPEPLRDAYTKTYSSTGFRHLLEWQSRRAIRYQEGFALLCVALNETANEDHMAILEIVADNLRREIRRTDLIGHSDGILTILLLYAGNGDPANVAERLRARIQNYAFPGRTPKERVRHTISIGGACFPLDAVESSLLVKRARHCLRRAQERGGNRVVMSGDGGS